MGSELVQCLDEVTQMKHTSIQFDMLFLSANKSDTTIPMVWEARAYNHQVPDGIL